MSSGRTVPASAYVPKNEEWEAEPVVPVIHQQFVVQPAAAYDTASSSLWYSQQQLMVQPAAAYGTASSSLWYSQQQLKVQPAAADDTYSQQPPVPVISSGGVGVTSAPSAAVWPPCWRAGPMDDIPGVRRRLLIAAPMDRCKTPYRRCRCQKQRTRVLL